MPDSWALGGCDVPTGSFCWSGQAPTPAAHPPRGLHAGPEGASFKQHVANMWMIPRGERAPQQCSLQGKGVSDQAHMASRACKDVSLTHNQPRGTVGPRLTRRSELHSLTSICLQGRSLQAGPWESVAPGQAATHRKPRLPRATSVDSHLVQVLTRWESAGSDLTLGEPQSPS